ncbi:MAG TPA: NPCBM/NEW2 domain-containing protein [Candidatus Saccharimonadales bacterium]|nr:NPCBM/NEW2 domain-containing protein [Candidatus Saccharimonadales bacterium]
MNWRRIIALALALLATPVIRAQQSTVGHGGGGATNGIQMLGGSGTNTSLRTPTLINPTFSGGFSGTLNGNPAGLSNASASASGIVSSSRYLESFAAPADSYWASVAPVPPIILETAFGNTGGENETTIKEAIDGAVTNGFVNAGVGWLLIDDCFAYRASPTADLQANPAWFPGGMSNLVYYAHQRGLKVIVYFSDDPSGFTSAANASSYGHEIQDAGVCATNWLVDGFKMEGDTDTASFQREQLFLQTCFQTGRKFWVQSTTGLGSSTYSGASVNLDPAIDSHQKWSSANYVSLPGSWDPTADPSWDNLWPHFYDAVKRSDRYRVGHYAEFAGNFINGPFGGSYGPLKGWLEMAVMIPAPIDWASSETWTLAYSPKRQMLTNSFYQAMLLNPYVSGATEPYMVVIGNRTNSISLRPMDSPTGPDYAAWFRVQSTNSIDGAVTLTLPLTNLVSSGGSFTTKGSNVWTFFNPWSGAIEAYATNQYSAAWTGPTSQLFRISPGFKIPPFAPGANLMGDFYFTGFSSNAPAASVGIIRNLGQNSAALTIAGVTYSNGVSMTAPASITYPLGAAVSSFSGTFGLEDRIVQNGDGTTVALAVYVDGVLAWQSASIGTSAGATNFVINTAGAKFITFALSGVPGSASQPLYECGDLTGSFNVPKANGQFAPALLAVKNTDTTRTTTTTFADDPELQVVLEGGATYQFDGQLVFWNSTTGAGFKAQSSFTGSTWFFQGRNVDAQWASTILDLSYPDHNGDTFLAFNRAPTYQDGSITTRGVISTKTGGVFKVQWAQQTSSAATTHLGQGSYLRFTRIR